MRFYAAYPEILWYDFLKKISDSCLSLIFETACLGISGGKKAEYKTFESLLCVTEITEGTCTYTHKANVYVSNALVYSGCESHTIKLG